MADDLGKRLLAEVEEMGLDEVLHCVQLRSHDGLAPIPYFGLPTLDSMLHAVHSPATARANSSPPIIELTSLTPGGGSTHLLYHLCAIATLPQTHGGRHASVVLVDADNTFSIPRLALQLAYQVKKSSPSEPSADIERTVLDSLSHIHVLRPQSLASTIASLRALPTYLFDPSKHHSLDRAIAFLALDSATAFHWQARATDADSGGTAAPGAHDSHASLAEILRSVSRQLACPVILTAHLLHSLPPAPVHQLHSVLRPTLPAALASLPTLRLLVRRVHVRRFPAGISEREARREAADRQRAVDIRRFECMVNGWGMEEGLLRGLRSETGGFEFRIVGDGVVMEDAGEEEERRRNAEVGEHG